MLLLPVFLFAVQGVPAAAPFVVDHKPVSCVVAGKHPMFTATAPAGAEVASARVYFQGKSRDWYSVAMKAEGAVLSAALPSPRKDLAEFRYYIEATSKNVETARTPDVTARVVGGAPDCGQGAVAAVATVTSILVQGPAGAAAVPAGFAPSGLVAAGVGGGISATTVAVTGAAVAGAGVVAATQLGGGGGADVAYAGPFSADLTFNLPNGCRFVQQMTMTLTIEVPQSETGEGQYGMDGAGRAVVLSSNCAGVQVGTAGAFGIQGGTFRRSGATISFSEVSNPSSSVTRTFAFQGTLSASTITGSATLTERASDGTAVSGSATVQMTLTKR